MKPPILKFFVFICCMAATHMCHAQASFFDPSFGSGGKTIAPLGTTENGKFDAVAIQLDGKIVVAGIAKGKAIVARFKEDGSPDTTFATNGYYTYSTAIISHFYDLALQPDGKIIAEGSSLLSDDEFFTLRLNINGSPDAAFGAGGIVTTDMDIGNDNAYGVALQTDGKIVVVGNVSSYNIGVLRLEPNGVVDNTFATGGKQKSVLGEAHDVDIAPDGKIVVGGQSSATPVGLSFMVARYLPDGSEDISFNHTGIVHTLAGDSWNYGDAVKVQSDGKILIAGTGTFGSQGGDFVVLRYNTDGSLDGGFGAGGIVHIDFNSKGDRARAISLTPDGKIILTGEVTINDREDFGIVRLNTDGSPDNTFGIGGKIATSIRDLDDEAHAIALQADGRIVLAGQSAKNNPYVDPVIARYMPYKTGINDAPDIMEIELLYPNPASGKIYMRTAQTKAIAGISAIDVLGRKMNMEWNADTHCIPTGNLKNGLYSFVVAYNNGELYTQKIMLKNNM